MHSNLKLTLKVEDPSECFDFVDMQLRRDAIEKKTDTAVAPVMNFQAVAPSIYISRIPSGFVRRISVKVAPGAHAVMLAY